MLKWIILGVYIAICITAPYGPIGVLFFTLIFTPEIIAAAYIIGYIRELLRNH